MNTLLRTGLLLVALAAGLAGIGLAQRDLVADLSSELFDSQGLRQRIRYESQLSQHLEQRSNSITSCNLGKLEAVEELLSDQISLAQAAARFQMLDRRFSYRDEAMFRAIYSGATEEDRYCRQVIAFVASRRFDCPAEAAMAAARFSAELESSIWVTHGLQERNN
jgi:hypothetical protein